MKTKQTQRRIAPGAFAVLFAALLFAFSTNAEAEMLQSQTITETRITSYPVQTIIVDGKVMQASCILAPSSARTVVERSVSVMPAEKPLFEAWLFYPPDNRMEHRKLIADVQPGRMEKTTITYRNGQPVMVQKVQIMKSAQDGSSFEKVTTTETKTEVRSPLW